MKRRIISLFLAMCIFITGCSGGSQELSDQEAEEIAVDYFRRTYHRKVTYQCQEKLQVGEHEYLDIAIVSCDGKELKLALDEQKKPLADNGFQIACVEQAENRIGEKHNLPTDARLERYDTVFETSASCYISECYVALRDIPQEETKDAVWELLQELRLNQIDQLILEVLTPAFLYQKVGSSLQLEARAFPTDDSYEDYEAKYEAFRKSFFWDKEIFDQKLAAIQELGYQDAYFYMDGSFQGRIINIVLHCPQRNDSSENELEAMLEDMDENCFSIDGCSILYTVEYGDES